MNVFWLGFATLAFACFMLKLVGDSLEDTGKVLGDFLRLPHSVVSSTFQAFATSGPEIVMAVIVVFPFISEGWQALDLAEKTSSGALNMCFSAMDNLAGIGAFVLVIGMLFGGFFNEGVKIDPRETIPRIRSSMVSLIFYIVSASVFTYAIWDGVLELEYAYKLMIIGVVYVLFQFVSGPILKNVFGPDPNAEPNEREDVSFGGFLGSGIIYLLGIGSLVILVQIALKSTYDMAVAVEGISLGGILLAVTSYMSSMPELLLAFAFLAKGKKNSLLGMLFASNVIDLAFSGFYGIWNGTDMQIYTTGSHPGLLKFYILALPVTAVFAFIGFSFQKVKYWMAYPTFILYIGYIIYGFMNL